MDEPLIPKHGGYRRLKSFQIAQLVYDVTVRFCDRYIDKRSRTHDQMVQAARSGVQNIAEGSQASGTSKKTELKLTNVARASLEELRRDYEDFLRQRGFCLWEKSDPLRQELVDVRAATADDVARWVKAVHDRALSSGQRGLGGQSGHSAQPERSTSSTSSTLSTDRAPLYPELAANAALVLINVACALLDRQIGSQAEAFEREGGFTERLYHNLTGNTMVGTLPIRLMFTEADGRILASDENYFIQPYTDEYISMQDAEWSMMNLAQWQAFSGQDMNSKAAWFTTFEGEDPVTELFVNDTAEDKTFTLESAYIDLDQQKVTETFTLAPFTSRVLITE